MMGVLSVIAMLAGLVVPKVFKVIEEGKIKVFAAELNTIKTATTEYFINIGELPQNDTQWFQRDYLMQNTENHVKWNGPHLEKMLDSSSLGGAPYFNGDGIVCLAADKGATTTGDNGFDLNGDALSDISGRVVELYYTSFSIKDFELLDSLIDGDSVLMGGNDINLRMVRGRVKFNATAADLGDLRVYIAHH